MPRAKDIAMSTMLQGIAEGLDQGLEELAGERIGFVLVICPFNTIPSEVQYVANVQRADGSKLIENVLQRWQQGLPDVPTHQRN